MPQTTYNLDTVAAVPGQLVSGELDALIGRYSASEAIPPGCMTELHTDGKLRLYRGGKKAGIALYRSAKEPGAWQVDDYVPVVRRGLVWAALAGSEGNALAAVNFSYADTTTTDRGKATASLPAVTSDAQVYDGGPCKFGDASITGAQVVECAFDAEDLSPSPFQTLLSQAANDYAVPAEHLKVFEINTTAANSTVSLPASAPNGTVCFIVADGTKNGHTLTFRDVTTSISAATTASKRVAATAVKAGGAWAVTLTVGP